ncbi:MAG: hypothetical protein COU63_03165 [Candidatus Pacebacteria bacterium CG10_big_fil_rev_8_21_14_0_10_36_11]|nr:response regulator [Candidatus Pacearchaeota archaeon]OIP74425.1 MAG: hypothetical protein AUK08_01415 [Candidatus Pacebacteria bacterium CG2_30_36_39]PIR64989.1 MAG: hypothetical protein COU63_03165 [Candidatus Pacebacteria bacterium CG10_big_fil_rev_8_21_14_0_10_36_11]PJC42353.1 MAG: hypothetical protein CO040_04905 [Candidatus Pacebacteria bacterium CG_4_9_14_0_2_um_filter_36_8]
MSDSKERKFNVLLAEDNEDWVATVEDIITEIGGVLVKTATNLEDAIDAMAMLEELKVDIIILGGSLGEFKIGNTDTLRILIALMEARIEGGFHANKAKTIGLSGDHQTRIKELDAQLGKNNIDNLKATILRLLAK